MILWLARLPTASALGLIVAAVVAACLGLLVLFHAVLPRALRQSHNDVAGFTLSIVGVTYAVLLAFVAVAVWQAYDKASGLVQAEANLVGDLTRDAVGLPEPLAAALRRELTEYSETVVQLEWPALAGAEPVPDMAWGILERVHLGLVRDRADDPWVLAVKADMLRQLDSLYDARRSRLQAARADLPPILWWNLLGGAAVVITFSCLFGTPNIAMHAAMVGLLATSMSLVLALVLLLYNPYVGRNHVSATPFNALVAGSSDPR